MKHHKPLNKRVFGVLFYLFLLCITLVWIIPLFTLVLTAIKSKKDLYGGMGLFTLPSHIEWSNFSRAMVQGRMMMYMKNDLLICCLKVPLGIFIESMAAYAMTRLPMKRPTAVFVFFLLGMMLPMQIALVPINVAFTRLHLLNTYFGLFYVYVAFGISFGILVLRGFFKGIPKAMDEAAQIEGCSHWQVYSRIIMPIAKPAVSTLLIMDFLSTWNEYLLASIIINDNTKKTVPVGLLTFVGEHGTEYSYLCAGILISIVPVMMVYLFFQRYFVEGMAGAVK